MYSAAVGHYSWPPMCVWDAVEGLAQRVCVFVCIHDLQPAFCIYTGCCGVLDTSHMGRQAIAFVLAAHSVLSIGMPVVTFLVLQRELEWFCVCLPHVQTVLLLLHGIQTAFYLCLCSPASLSLLLYGGSALYTSLSLSVC